MTRPSIGKRIAMPPRGVAKGAPIVALDAPNFHLQPKQSALIVQPAVLLGKLRSETMLDAARRTAADANRDRRLRCLE